VNRTHFDYVRDIYESVQEIEQFMLGLTKEQFVEDRKTILAITKLIEIIGEASKGIPEEVREMYCSIPWKQMTGMRDKLTHKYYGIDLQVLWETATNKIPMINKPIQEMMKDFSVGE
jgi:uncharacterized protein with HEPN domain